MKTLKEIDQFLRKTEEIILISLVVLLVFLAFFQVILRNIFSAGIIWADIFLRQLVLWIGLLGAVVVTSERRHLKIDVFSKLIAAEKRPLVNLVIDSFSLFITILLTKASYVFVMLEKEGGSILFLNIPAWVMESIIPVSFALMSFHFLLRVIEDIFEMTKKEPK